MESLRALGFEPGVLLVNIVGFLLLAWFFKAKLYQPIGKFMASRTEEIDAQIRKAGELHDAAEREHQNLQAELDKQREAARAEIAILTQQAKAAIEDLQRDARQQRQEMVEMGRLELERSRQAAMADLQRVAGDMAVEIADKLIRSSLDEQRQAALVEQFVLDVRAAAEKERSQ
jgi:F-type H+-transporting ATPase subunit b